MRSPLLGSNRVVRPDMGKKGAYFGNRSQPPNGQLVPNFSWEQHVSCRVKPHSGQPQASVQSLSGGGAKQGGLSVKDCPTKDLSQKREGARTCERQNGGRG